MFTESPRKMVTSFPYVSIVSVKKTFISPCLFHFFVIVYDSFLAFFLYFSFFSTFLFVICCFTDKEISSSSLSSSNSMDYFTDMYVWTRVTCDQYGTATIRLTLMCRHVTCGSDCINSNNRALLCFIMFT